MQKKKKRKLLERIQDETSVQREQITLEREESEKRGEVVISTRIQVA